MTFNSVYSVGSLVEYINNNKDEHTTFGFITAVNFWKSDAVNYCASYSIEQCNTKIIDTSVAESNIKRSYCLAVKENK